MTDFDPNDVFDAAAVWCCFVMCDRCNADLDIDAGPDRGLSYYHALGQRARRSGWWIEDRSIGNDPDYNMLCPNCAAGEPRPPTSFTGRRPPNAVLTICSMTAQPGELDR